MQAKQQTRLLLAYLLLLPALAAPNCGGAGQKCCLSCPPEIRAEGGCICSNSTASSAAIHWCHNCIILKLEHVTTCSRYAVAVLMHLLLCSCHSSTAAAVAVAHVRCPICLLLQSVISENARAAAPVTCSASGAPKQQMARLRQT